MNLLRRNVFRAIQGHQQLAREGAHADTCPARSRAS
jgi:hypothetical protein